MGAEEVVLLPATDGGAVWTGGGICCQLVVPIIPVSSSKDSGDEWVDPKCEVDDMSIIILSFWTSNNETFPPCVFAEQVKSRERDPVRSQSKTGKGAGNLKCMDGGVAVPLPGGLCFASDLKLDSYCAHLCDEDTAYVCTYALLIKIGVRGEEEGGNY